MAYQYDIQKRELFTDEGSRIFLKVRDRVQRLLSEAGAVRMQEAWGDVGIGDSWTGLACLDRMVELGEVRELTEGMQVAGQHRVFVKA